MKIYLIYLYILLNLHCEGKVPMKIYLIYLYPVQPTRLDP